MKKLIPVWLLLAQLTLVAQSSLPSAFARVAAIQQQPASVIFTFNAACENCSTQQSETADNLYLIEIPAANGPTLAKSGEFSELSLEVRFRGDRLIYVLSFEPGTSPRATWRNGGTVLQVNFTPKTSSNGSTQTSSTSSSANGAGVANSANNLGTDNDAAKFGAANNGGTGPAANTPVAGNSARSAAPSTPQTGSSQLDNLSQPVNRDEKGSTAYAAVDMSVPESPAFTVLGVTPQTVTRPTSPRAFATSLLNGVDTNGNFQSGLAMDFVPYLLLAGDDLTLRNYQTRYVTRFLARSQFSFGTTKGATEDDKSLRLALGLHVTLWDRGDPRMDETLINCLGQMKTPRRPSQLEPELLGTTPADVAEFNRRLALYTEDKARYERDKQAAIEFNNAVSTRCREQAHERNWNRSSWIIAAAPSWITLDGQTKNFQWNGGGFWTSLAYGFEGVSGLENRSQLIVHARYRSREQTPDPNVAGKFVTQDNFFAGVRFRHGSPTFNGSLEYVLDRWRPVGRAWDNSSRLSLGFERKIVGDTWFNLSLGGQTGRSDGKNNGFVLTSFKWAFSDRKNVANPAIQ